MREFESCAPLWRSFAGWRTPTTAARRWEDLPERAREYLLWIEGQVGVPISTVSVGAERDAEIRREVRVA